MTEKERAVLQAAFALVKAEANLQQEPVSQAKKMRAFNTLIDTCADLASENDGQLVIRQEAAPKLLVALQDIAHGMVPNLIPANDPLTFRTAVLEWSQKRAKAAIAEATGVREECGPR